VFKFLSELTAYKHTRVVKGYIHFKIMLSTKINYFTLKASMKELGTTFDAVDPDDSTA
jgi:hypothetical protein